MSYYHIDDDLSKIWDIDDNHDQFVIDYLCEPIDNDKD